MFVLVELDVFIEGTDAELFWLFIWSLVNDEEDDEEDI
jgi:hypothetical protein